MKDFIKVICVLGVICAAGVNLCHATQSFVVDKYEYTITDLENHEVSVKATRTVYRQPVIIPSLVSDSYQREYIVTAVSDKGFRGVEVTQITLPETIKEIGSAAFENCRDLVTINFPEDLSVIGDRAFRNCTDLITVNMPDGLRKIGDCAFENTGLVSVTIPAKLRTIGQKSFSNCEDLENVTILGNIDGLPKRIAAQAFMECTRLKSLTLDNTPLTIEDEAFLNCLSLTTLSLPELTEYIGACAFKDCKSIYAIYYPAKVPCDTFYTPLSPTIPSDPYDDRYDPFGNNVNQRATLYVPASSIEIYRNRLPWKMFNDIEPYEFSGIKDCPKNFNELLTYAVYNLTGTKVASESTSDLKPGIYIVIQNGISNKIVVK